MLGRSSGEEHGNPLQYSCLENPHGQRILMGYRLWGHRESDTTEQLSTSKLQKAEHQRIDAFELWGWRRLLRVPWTARPSSQSILKEINPEYSLQGLMLKLKLQYLSTWCKELTHWKRPWYWEGLKANGEGGSRGRDGYIASQTHWIWISANFGR